VPPELGLPPVLAFIPTAAVVVTTELGFVQPVLTVEPPLAVTLPPVAALEPPVAGIVPPFPRDAVPPLPEPVIPPEPSESPLPSAPQAVQTNVTPTQALMTTDTLRVLMKDQSWLSLDTRISRKVRDDETRAQGA
jgi:hypothetical protein